MGRKTDVFCCPHCGSKLRLGLVSAETGRSNLPSSPEPLIAPIRKVEPLETLNDGVCQRLEDIEKQAILIALRRAGNDKVLAARMLGIGRTSIYRKLGQYSSDSKALSTSVSTNLATENGPLDETEKHRILTAMQANENDRQLVAQILGIGRTTLYRRLREYGFPRSHRPASNATKKSSQG